MTKKKILSRLGLAMMTAIACIGFTSCSESNDGPEAPPVLSSSYVVTFELSDDVLNTADITAHIANPDGTFRDAKVTETKQSWTLKGDKLPDKAGILFTFVPKTNIDKSKTYDIAISGGISVTSYKNEGVIDAKGHSGSSGMSIQGDKLEQYYVGRGTGFAYGVSEDGTITRLDVDSFDFGLNGLWEWVAGWMQK